MVSRRLVLTLLVLASFVLLGAATGAWAQLVPVGSEFRLGSGGAAMALNQTTGAMVYVYPDADGLGGMRALSAFNGVGVPQPRPEPISDALAAPSLGWSGADGVFLAAWASSEGVLLRRLSAFGDPLAATTTLATGSLSCVGLARDLRNGNALVTWLAHTTPNVEQVITQLVNASGEPVHEPVPLGSPTVEPSLRACRRLAWNPATGGYLVVWDEGSSVLSASVGPDGTPGRTRTLTTKGAAYPEPVVAIAPGGTALVVWRGKVAIPGRRATETELVAQPLDRAGAPSGKPRRLTHVGVDGEANRGLPWNPAVVATPGGGFVVVWDANRGPAGVGRAGIYAQETRGDGRVRGQPLRVSEANGLAASPSPTGARIELVPKRPQQPEPLYVVTWTTESINLARPFLPEGAIRLLVPVDPNDNTWT